MISRKIRVTEKFWNFQTKTMEQSLLGFSNSISRNFLANLLLLPRGFDPVFGAEGWQKIEVMLSLKKSHLWGRLAEGIRSTLSRRRLILKRDFPFFYKYVKLCSLFKFALSHTVWKLWNFSVTKILREINFGYFEAPRTYLQFNLLSSI